MRGYSPSPSSIFVTLHCSKFYKNYLISFIKLSWDFGGGASYFFYSTTYYFLSFAPFLSSFLAPLPPFLSSFFFSSSRSFLRVKRGPFTICNSYSVRASPFYCLSSSKNFCLAFLAFYALPSCLSSQDFLVYFYFSSCRVSLTKAIASSPATWTDQYTLLVD